ncbi:MAG: SDR family oxidoreductase, partial [Bacilli bacterium]
EDDWDAVLDTNLKGAFLTTKAASRHMMRNRKGAIINITSIVGITGAPGQSNYAAAKSGLIGFTKAVAKELSSRNITVNCVAPGFITTDMTDVLKEEYKQEILKLIPLARFGQPSDVAHAVTYLASDAASYMTGQTLRIDGGMGM